MREIKFRAIFNYIPSNEKCLQIFYISKGFNTNVDPWQDFQNAENWEQVTMWEQYTGLKDKNGVEIYEGDILQGGFYYEYEVKWFDSGWNIQSDNMNLFQIIGNIHQ